MEILPPHTHFPKRPEVAVIKCVSKTFGECHAILYPNMSCPMEGGKEERGEGRRRGRESGEGKGRSKEREEGKEREKGRRRKEGRKGDERRREDIKAREEKMWRRGRGKT